MSRDAAHPLLVDLYELTMADVYCREGLAERLATFSLFVRKLPPTRGYLVAAGVDDALTWLEELRFGDEELAVVERLGVFAPSFLNWLADFRFTGMVRAAPEGTIAFADEPFLEVTAPIAQAQLAETFLLNQLTLQTTLATKAARCRHAAGGRTVVDFALRRTHGIDAGMKLVKVCRLVGLDATSNIAGADRYGMRAAGTMAHAFVQAYEHEIDAFRAFARAYGAATVLIVDTYDTRTGVRRALQVAKEMREQGITIRGIRLDSGDLAADARYARQLFDEAGLSSIQVFVSGGLDEYEIHGLVQVAQAPIDGFGVGSSLGISTDAPGLDSVYKLVEFDGRPVRKTSPGKANWPGAKQVWRSHGWAGDILALAEEPPPVEQSVALLEVVMVDGRRTPAGRRTLEDSNRHFEEQWSTLPEGLLRLNDPDRYPVRPSARLRDTASAVDAQREEG
jgi:nicotinate phosphoribosyltransferase